MKSFFKKKPGNDLKNRLKHPTPPPPPPPLLTPPPPPPKRLLKDFFSIDITTIRPDEGETVLLLDHFELGLFNKIKFYFTSDGTVNISFLSPKRKFNSELIYLINSCAATFGPTYNGDSFIKPHELASRGYFSRLWKDIWFDTTYIPEFGIHVLGLTIHNVEKAAYTMLSLPHAPL